MPFSSIIGHERPVNVLKRALAHDALAHAFLFSGEPGIGKQLTARELAGALNCQRPSPDGGCGTCPSCRKVSSGSHPDVHLLLPDGDVIKIDQVREAQAGLSLRPFEGRKKVLIVDSAEAMNDAAQNAFLKTLEEPPGESLIILITSMPQSLLPTIRSRCQELKFQPLPRQVLAKFLQEKRGLDESDAWFAAALSRGSLGSAIEMDVQKEKTDREQFMALHRGLAGMRHDEVLALAEGISKDREGFDRLLDIGIEWLRDRLVFQETGDEHLLVFSGGADRISSERESIPRARMLQDMELLALSRSLLDRRVSAQLVAENLFLKLGRA